MIQTRIPFRSILGRITGFSTPVFGLSWQPAEPEREAIRRLFVFLEDRRVLYVPRNLEVLSEVSRSVLAIREEVTRTLQDVSEDSKAAPALRAMRAACRKFLTTPFPDFPNIVDRVRWDRRPEREGEPGFFVALGEPRDTLGVHLGTLAVAYGIDVESELAALLPPTEDDDSFDGSEVV